MSPLITHPARNMSFSGSIAKTMNYLLIFEAWNQDSTLIISKMTDNHEAECPVAYIFNVVGPPDTMFLKFRTFPHH
jgi:hypothetical protein